MNFTQEQLNILVECKVAEINGALVQVDLKYPPPPSSAALGVGPKLSLDCIKRFLDVDPTLVWTRWIFHQAAGGARGLEGSKQALAALKDRFMQERTKGYYDDEANEHYDPIPEKEAEECWRGVEKRYADMLHFTDQDCVDKAGAYGFYRDWPGGPSKVYDRIVTVTSEFLSLVPKAKEMNEELARTGSKPVNLLPSEFATVDDLEKAIKRVNRFYASKEARDDIRVDRIYKSSMIEVLAPLTYAASVRYGYERWPWSNNDQFETLLTSENTFSNAWKSACNNGVYVFIKIHGEVPSWVARLTDSRFTRRYLTNLCLQLTTDMETEAETCQVWNEDHESWTFDHVRRIILDEPTRDVAEVEEMPVVRGGRAYKTPEEAQAVINELGKAVAAIEKWRVKFDRNKIVPDALKLHA